MRTARIFGVSMTAVVALGASAASAALAAPASEAVALEATATLDVASEAAAQEAAAEASEEAAEAAEEAASAGVDRAARKLPAYARRIGRLIFLMERVRERKAVLRSLPLWAPLRQSRLPLKREKLRGLWTHIRTLRGEIRVKEKAWLIAHGF
jgi:hypothetical protein